MYLTVSLHHSLKYSPVSGSGGLLSEGFFCFLQCLFFNDGRLLNIHIKIKEKYIVTCSGDRQTYEKYVSCTDGTSLTLRVRSSLQSSLQDKNMSQSHCSCCLCDSWGRRWIYVAQKRHHLFPLVGINSFWNWSFQLSDIIHVTLKYSFLQYFINMV